MSLIAMSRKSQAIRKTASISGFTNSASVAPGISSYINSLKRNNIVSQPNKTASDIIQSQKSSTLTNELIPCPNAKNGSSASCNNICNVTKNLTTPGASDRIESLKKRCIN